MTEKQFNVVNVDGTVFLEDHKEGSYHIGELGNVDVICLNDIADRLNKLNDENKTFRKALQELKEIGDYQELRIKELNDENEQLKSQREDFKRALSGKDKEIMKLRRENNQMKRYLND